MTISVIEGYLSCDTHVMCVWQCTEEKSGARDDRSVLSICDQNLISYSNIQLGFFLLLFISNHVSVLIESRYQEEMPMRETRLWNSEVE